MYADLYDRLTLFIQTESAAPHLAGSHGYTNKVRVGGLKNKRCILAGLSVRTVSCI